MYTSTGAFAHRSLYYSRSSLEPLLALGPRVLSPDDDVRRLLKETFGLSEVATNRPLARARVDCARVSRAGKVASLRGELADGGNRGDTGILNSEDRSARDVSHSLEIKEIRTLATVYVYIRADWSIRVSRDGD